MRMVFKKERLGRLLSKVGSGVTPKGGSDSYVPEGVPLIRSQNVLWGKLSTEGIAFIDAQQHAKMAGSFVLPNDVLLNITGASIGRACVVPDSLGEANVNQHVCILRAGDKLDPEYLSNFLISQQGQREIALFQAGGNREGLNYEQVKSFEIPLPPIAEQRKIAEILRTWDEAIETAEAEIKAKQERKRWLMDKLLVGNWPKRTIEELFELEGSGIDKVILPDEQVVPLVNYMDAYRKRVLTHADVQAETSVSPNDLMRCQLKRGDIVLTPSSETPDDIAHSALINFEPGNAVHSYHLFRLRTRSDDEIVHDFRAFFLNHISVRRQFIRICSGTTRFTLTLPGVRAIKVSLPPIKHQQYAAEVLNDATSQEELASRRVESLRAQKRGLMQKLLTGDVRVAA